jgi:hypothetical protein
MVLWDGLDEAIVGVAKKEKLGPIIISNAYGEIDIELDEEFYYEDEENNLDSFNREEFSYIVVYNIHKIIEILMEDMEVDMDTLEENETEEGKKNEMALEYYEFNIGCAYVGIHTPIHLYIAENNKDFIK